ncbi:MAG: hypothetical protein E7774_07230, partial [Bradyrhizobium sp.]
MRRIAISIAAALAWAGSPSVQAHAETIDVYDDHGGVVPEYDARWAALAARGVNVRIVGPCQSACTVLLAHIPYDHICVTPQARFGFHQAKFPRSTEMMWAGYSQGIRDWINARGGLTPDFKWMGAP